MTKSILVGGGGGGGGGGGLQCHSDRINPVKSVEKLMYYHMVSKLCKSQSIDMQHRKKS